MEVKVKVGAFNVLSQGVSNCGTGLETLQSKNTDLTPQSVFNDLNRFAEYLRLCSINYDNPEPYPNADWKPETQGIKDWIKSIDSNTKINDDILQKAWNQFEQNSSYFFEKSKE